MIEDTSKPSSTFGFLPLIIMVLVGLITIFVLFLEPEHIKINHTANFKIVKYDLFNVYLSENDKIYKVEVEKCKFDRLKLGTTNDFNLFSYEKTNKDNKDRYYFKNNTELKKICLEKPNYKKIDYFKNSEVLKW